MGRQLQIFSTRWQDQAVCTGIQNLVFSATVGPLETDGDTASPLLPVTKRSWEELRAIP